MNFRYKIASTLKELISTVHKKGFFHLLSSNIFIHFLTFGSQLIVAWILTAEDLGRIKLMQTFTEILMIVAGAGVPVSIVKLCSEQGIGNLKYAFFKSGFLFVILSSSFCYLILIFSSSLGVLSNDPLVNDMIKYYGILLFPMTFNQVFVSFFQADRNFKTLSVIQSLTKVFSILIILPITYYFLLQGYIFAMVIGFLSTTIFLAYKINIFQILKIKYQDAVKKQVLKEIFSLGKYSVLANGIGRTNNYLNFLILSYLIIDRERFGQYSFALTMVQGLQIITTTVQQITVPYFSEKSNDTVLWLKAFKKYNKYFLIQVAVVFLIATIVLPPLISFVFSGKYDDSIPFLRILIIGWALRNIYSLKGPALIGLGKININFYNTLLVFLVSVPIVYFLVNLYGIYGAAYSYIIQGIIALFIVNISFGKVVKRLTNN